MRYDLGKTITCNTERDFISPFSRNPTALRKGVTGWYTQQYVTMIQREERKVSGGRKDINDPPLEVKIYPHISMPRRNGLLRYASGWGKDGGSKIRKSRGG